MTIEDFFLFFRSQEWLEIVGVLQPIGILVIILFLMVIFWGFSRSTWLDWKFLYDWKAFLEGGPPTKKKKSEMRWKGVKRKLKSGQQKKLKAAVEEAVDIADDILAKIGYRGKNVRKRLENAPEAQILHYDELLQAVDIYENLVQDSQSKLSKEKAQEAVDIIEKFLREYGYLS